MPRIRHRQPVGFDCTYIRAHLISGYTPFGIVLSSPFRHPQTLRIAVVQPRNRRTAFFRTARATGRFLVKRSGQSTGTEHTVCSFQDYPINIQKNQRLQHDYTNEQAYTEITTEKNKTSRCRSTNQAKPVQRHPRARHKAKAHEIPRTYRTSGHRNEKARQIHGRSRKEPS